MNNIKKILKDFMFDEKRIGFLLVFLPFFILTILCIFNTMNLNIPVVPGYPEFGFRSRVFGDIMIPLGLCFLFLCLMYIIVGLKLNGVDGVKKSG